MTNFPGNWLNFSEYKEIKRVREALTETITLKVQITMSAFIAIGSAFFGNVASGWPVCRQVLFVFVACLLIAGVIWEPDIYNCCKGFGAKNDIVNGKKAINIFDDEIVYNIMIATEFEKLMEAEDKDELKIFYKAEMTYYVKKSMESLNLMTASCPRIFGMGKQQVSIERVRNINAIINELLAKCMTIDETIENAFNVFAQRIDSL